MQGKHILLGVSGSISAYKAAYLVRNFIKAGADVRVIMTQGACSFISPLTFSTLSRNEVNTELINEKGDLWNNHVDLALWADLLLVAPATANTISEFAHGLCDNLLSAVYLSARCPVFIAPAMDTDMWQHPATKKNIGLLESYGNHIIRPGTGELASGLEGEGRLAEPDEIQKELVSFFGIQPG